MRRFLVMSASMRAVSVSRKSAIAAAMVAERDRNEASVADLFRRRWWSLRIAATSSAR